MKKIECTCPLLHEHATLRMYTYHGCRCTPCRAANAAKADAWRNGGEYPKSNRWIDRTGSIRRLRALAAIGIPRAVIAAHLGVSERHVQALRDGVHPRMRRDTAERITAVYELLWDAPAEMRSENTRRQAAMRGYAVPMAWNDEDIDDPEATPQNPTKGTWDRKECGTEAAYRRHVRNKEPIDQACRNANSLAAALRKGAA